MSRILCLGIATLDIINELPSYPKEDSEVRALRQRICRGGNAANTAGVLAQAGHQVDFCGVLADDSGAQIIRQSFIEQGIGIKAHVQSGGTTPTSYITSSLESGSRSIVHYRDLQELNAADLPIDSFSSEYDWIHCEARNVEQLLIIITKLRQAYPQAQLSIEIEKEREAVDSLFSLADVLMLSKPFAQGRGWECAENALSAMKDNAPTSIISQTWGSSGAGVYHAESGYSFHAAKPIEVVDSIGAGDTFNAVLIDGLLQAKSPSDAVRRAMNKATDKCTREGFDGVL